MSKKDGPLILFDWAVKQLLRNRANFEVVEGFLSELLGRDIKITGVLESESNQTDPDFTYDRVDMTVEDELKEPVSVKIQFTYDTNCFQRMLYKTAKAATDPKIKKNCFINIVYFDVSYGKDYIYHNKTTFTGIHGQDIIELPANQFGVLGNDDTRYLYPEYYILMLSDFRDTVKNTLDEWIYFLKNNRIKDEFSAKGLLKAREILDYARLSPEEKAEHDRMLERRTRYRCQIEDAIKRGKREAEEEYTKEIEKVKEESAKLREKIKEENAKLRERLAEMERFIRDKQIES